MEKPTQATVKAGRPNHGASETGLAMPLTAGKTGAPTPGASKPDHRSQGTPTGSAMPSRQARAAGANNSGLAETRPFAQVQTR